MIYGAATSALASALERRAAPLTRLSLDHNPILDGGGAAIGAAVCGCRLVELSLAFPRLPSPPLTFSHLRSPSLRCGCRLVELSLAFSGVADGELTN